MSELISREIQWGKDKLIIETGKVAKQATASTIVRCGDTVVMCNVTAAKQAKPDIDFFPLTYCKLSRKILCSREKYQEGFLKEKQDQQKLKH